MTEDEITPHSDDTESLRFKVYSVTGQTYLCNRIVYSADNHRVLVNAYKTTEDYEFKPDLFPIDIIIDGNLDIVPLRKWITPKYFSAMEKLP